jgi:hypothetical protein
MKVRYKLHWAGSQRDFAPLKWQIWDWTIRHPVAHVENRAIGRTICALLNAQKRTGRHTRDRAGKAGKS